MPTRVFFAAVSAAILAVAAGCGPGKVNKTASFALGTDKPAVGYEANKQSAEQTLKIEVEADNSVNVFVVTGMTLDDAVNTLEVDLKAKAVASKLDAKKESFTASIPAGQKPVVVITLGKAIKASGSVKITN
jgi:maltose-binding protein MalE